MSEPQSQEVWKGGFGVEMSEEQFHKMMGHLNRLTSETERREVAVAKSLEDLKQIEAVRTYASVVKDITTSIQTLSQMQGTEKVIVQLMKSLDITNDQYHRLGVSTLEEKTNQSSLSVQTDPRTTK